MTSKIKHTISKPRTTLIYKNRPNCKRESLLDFDSAIRIPYGYQSDLMRGFPDVDPIVALNVAIQYALTFKTSISYQQDNSITKEDFRQYIKDADIMLKDVQRPSGMKESQVKAYLQKVQDILDKPDGTGEDRIFYFEERKRHFRTRVFYQPFNPKYKFNLCIIKVLRNGMLYVIKNPGQFFNCKTKQKYCMECNRYYEQRATNKHNSGCPIRCQACLRINPKDGPCKKDSPIECKACKRVRFLLKFKFPK